MKMSISTLFLLEFGAAQTLIGLVTAGGEWEEVRK